MVNAQFSLATFEYFILILVRTSAFAVTAPFFSDSSVPTRVKIGFSAILSILLYYVVPKEGVEYATVVGYAVLVLKEGITGLLIGFGASICNSIILFAGTFIDMDIGLSMVTQFDPNTHSQISITGQLYNYFLLLLLVVSNMHQYILRAMVDSFTLVPLGGMVFEADTLLAAMVKFITDLFIIGFRIVLPVFGCIMILNAILGVMAKVAPQMNMFAVGIQLKLLVGLAILFLTVFLLPDIANFIFREMKTIMVSFIEGMY